MCELASKEEDEKWCTQEDNGVLTPSVEVHFKHLIPTLCEKIRSADAVVGCVAWLTNQQVLTALSHLKYGTSIIVQKEDFLRPDTDTNTRDLYSKYAAIPPFNWQGAFGVRTGTKVEMINTTSDGHDDFAVRCCGNHNSTRNPSFPRMHNKFLVFGKLLRVCLKIATSTFEWLTPK